MFHKSHSFYIKSLYKRLLAEGSLFFDDRARLYVRNRVRSTFDSYKSCQDLGRVKAKIKEARKQLHRLEKANKGHQKSALKILEEVYGVRGKVRHGLLYPYLNAHRPADFRVEFDPFVPHAPRTAPPPKLCKPLQALIKQHLGKKLEPDLPVPLYKPLHPGRKANLLWRYRSMLLDRLSVPLPFEIVCELELKAGAAGDHPLSCNALGDKGGPKWEDFYAPITHATINIPHLQPSAVLPARSSFIRKEPIPPSPYENTRIPSLVDFIEKDKFNESDKENVTLEHSRQKRRLYRRLLLKIPLINVFKAKELWDNTKTYTVTSSNWVPRAIHQLLEDVPSKEVIETTLQWSSKSKKRSSKK